LLNHLGGIETDLITE